MSVVPASGGGLAPIDNPLGRPEGLEDFGATEAVMPTFRINHQGKTFVDSLSGAEYPKLPCVILGRVRGRTLWPADLAPEGQTEMPLCRSYDFNTGLPVIRDKEGTLVMDRFPWEASGFEPTESPLPCGSCHLKDWDTHPNRKAPWCSEVHTFAIAVPTGQEGEFQPAIMQIQRSSIKASRTYCSAFAGKNQPMFTAWTELTLDPRKRGSNEYCVIEFTEIGATDAQYHPYFSATYRGIREFLTTPRGGDSEEETEDMPVTTEAEAPQVEQPAPAPEPAPVSEAPVAAPEPAPATAAPEPAPAPAAPVAAAAPAPAPAPAAPAPAPAPAGPMARPASGPMAAPAAPAPVPAEAAPAPPAPAEASPAPVATPTPPAPVATPTAPEAAGVGASEELPF